MAEEQNCEVPKALELRY